MLGKQTNRGSNLSFLLTGVLRSPRTLTASLSVNWCQEECPSQNHVAHIEHPTLSMAGDQKGEAVFSFLLHCLNGVAKPILESMGTQRNCWTLSLGYSVGTGRPMAGSEVTRDQAADRDSLPPWFMVGACD